MSKIVSAATFIAAAICVVPSFANAQAITFSAEACRGIAQGCVAGYSGEGFSSSAECFDAHTIGQGIPCDDAVDDDGNHVSWLMYVGSPVGHCVSRLCEVGPVG